MKTHYDVLGVGKSSQQEEIKKAYILRSKMLHPDRFDQSSQAAEWNLANEMLKELNIAYSILRDPSKRASYDASLNVLPAPAPAPVKRGSAQPTARQSAPGASSRTAPPSFDVGNLRANSLAFGELSAPARQKILERQSGAIKNQFRTRLEGIRWRYFWLAVSLTWFGLLFDIALRVKWDRDAVEFCVGGTAVACLVAANCTGWIVRWRNSPSKCFFYVTPLYLIRTKLEEISYWPLSQLKDVKAVHHYRNGFYSETSVRLLFDGRRETIKIRPKAEYSRMMEAIQAFESVIQESARNGNLSYFEREDDFRDQPESSKKVSEGRLWLRIRSLALTFALGALLFLGAYRLNQRLSLSAASQSEKVSVTKPLPGVNAPSEKGVAPVPAPLAPTRVQPPTPAPNDFAYGDPPTGSVLRNQMNAGFGVLELANPSKLPAVVKLVDLARATTVYSAFVRANETLTVANIPEGRYRLLYAFGKGWDWNSERFAEKHEYLALAKPLEFAGRNEKSAEDVNRDKIKVALGGSVDGAGKPESLAESEFEQY